MKILFVNEYAYPSVISGAEFSMHALAEALIANGHKVIILSPKLSSGKNLEQYKGVKLLNFWFPQKTRSYKVLTPLWFNNPLFWLYSTVIIIKTIIKEKIDIIHVHGKYILPGAIIAKLILKIPVVVTIRDYKFLCPLAICLIEQNKVCNWNYFLKEEINFYLSKYEPEKDFIHRLLLYSRFIFGKFLQQILLSFLKSSDMVIGVSKSITEIYQKSGINKEKLSVIYNIPPLIPKIFLKTRREKIILYVGKLSFGKGTDLLIKAFEKVKKKIHKAKLVLVGNKNPSISKIPNFVDYRGQLSHEKVGQYYKKASLFVLPSRWPEPLSRSTLEALSWGLPLIVSDKGGNKEVVRDGINGFLVKSDISQISEKILIILQNNKLAEKMSRESLKIRKRCFNKDEIIAKHLKLYKSLQK